MTISNRKISVATWLLAIVCLCPVLLKAQQRLPQPFIDSALSQTNSSVICGNDMMLYQLRQSPAFRAREEEMNRQILNALGTWAPDTLMLPVVIHIVNPAPYSITDAQVINGVKLLNDAFSKSGVYAASTGADTKIRFCLAQKDPDGGNTTGITRTTSYFSNHLNKDNEDAALKNLVQWDPSRYINIWLINKIEGEAHADFTCGSWYRLGVGGYATMPPSGGAVDGIVITGFGSLLAHEMGHYLGLYHTFEGGCTNNNCLTDGDRVCDTPPDGTVKPSAGCSSPTNSCSTDTLSAHSNGHFPTDVPDQIANFMDYGNGACSNEFTQGQADRMRAAVLTQRPGLLADECTKPCPDNIVANFTRDIDYSVIGNTINFTNTSTGASNFEWLVNGVVTATTNNFSYTFNTAAKDKITLKAFNSPGCFAASSDFVITGCGVTARFYTNKKTIASRTGILTDSIIFTNNSYNGVSYQWLISNDKGMAEHVESTNTNLTYVFPTPGNYKIRLVATNGTCSDTTDYYIVPVMDPTADGAPFKISLLCYGTNKVKVSFCIANYGYVSIPKNIPVSFYDADPRTPGANLLSTTYLSSSVPGGNCYKCFSHILNLTYSGFERVYVSLNDSGTVLPLVFPSTPFEEKNYYNNIGSAGTLRTTIYKTICQGQVYAGHNTTGTFIDTLASAANGCDSIRTLYLTVNPTKATTITTEICQGDNYAGHTSSGTYVDVYATSLGCDSTRTLYLTVKPVRSSYITQVICDGESYEGYTTSGNFTDVFTAANGCDSTRHLALTVKLRSFTTLNITRCEGESYMAGGQLQTRTGIYYDTLLNAVGCDSVITTNLTVNPLPRPDLGPDRGICIGDTMTLDPGSFSTYLWQDGSTGNVFRTQHTGRYSVAVENVFGCKASDTMQILRIDPLPKNFLRSDTSLCRGNIVHLKAPGFKEYNWNTGSKLSAIDVIDPGTYLLNVIDKNGCRGTDSVKIDYYKCATLWLPNAFTPNGDGNNDIFRPIFPAPVKNYKMQIRNRNGLLVFETSDYLAGWDGQYKSELQPVGVFVYLITFTDIDANDIQKKGTVTLVR